MSRRFGAVGIRRGGTGRTGDSTGRCPCLTDHAVMTTHAVVGSEEYEAGVVSPLETVVTSGLETTFTVTRC